LSRGLQSSSNGLTDLRGLIEYGVLARPDRYEKIMRARSPRREQRRVGRVGRDAHELPRRSDIAARDDHEFEFDLKLVWIFRAA